MSKYLGLRIVGPKIASLGEIGVSLSKIDEINTHLLMIFVRTATNKIIFLTYSVVTFFRSENDILQPFSIGPTNPVLSLVHVRNLHPAPGVQICTRVYFWPCERCFKNLHPANLLLPSRWVQIVHMNANCTISIHFDWRFR